MPRFFLLRYTALAIVILLKLTYLVNINAQCIIGIRLSTITLPGNGGAEHIHINSGTCDHYTETASDDWFYYYVDDNEGIIYISADANHEGNRTAFLTFHDIWSGKDHVITIIQDKATCEQLPSPGEISGSRSGCVTGPTTYSISPVAGASLYHWYINGNIQTPTASTATFDLSKYASPIAISVCGYNDCGNGMESTVNVTLMHTPLIIIQPLSQQVCEGGDGSFEISASDATSYKWQQYIGNWEDIPGAVSATFTTGKAVPSMNSRRYRGLASNSCGTVVSNEAILNVVSVSPAGEINGKDSICPGQEVVSYTIDAISGATEYQWSVPSGATIVSGSNTNSIVVTFSQYFTQGSLSVRGMNTGCYGAISPEFNVVVNSVPTPGMISGPENVCVEGSQLIYSVLPVEGAMQYSWSLPDSACVGSSTSQSIDVTYGNSSGYITVIAYNSSGCASLPSSKYIKYSSLVPYNVYGGGTICPGNYSNVTLLNSLTENSYNLYLDGVFHSSMNGTGSSLKWDRLGAPGTYTITGLTSEGCEVPMNGSASIFILTRSTDPTSIISNPTNICPGSSSTLNVSGGSLGTGAEWKWYKYPSLTPFATGNSITVSPLSPNTYSVKAVGRCNTTNSVSARINVLSEPVIIEEPVNDTICEGSSTNFNVYATGATNFQWQQMGEYQWENITGANSSYLNIDGSASMNGKEYRCLISNECYTVSSNSAILTVNYTGAAGDISGVDMVCPGQSNIEYSIKHVYGANSYSWTVPEGATIISDSNANSIVVNFSWNAVSGEVSVSGIGNCGFGQAMNLPVTVSNVLIPQVRGTAIVCPSSTGYIYSTETGMSDYSWIVIGGDIISGGNKSDNTVTISWGSPGEGHVKVNYANQNGCMAASQTDLAVTIHQLTEIIYHPKSMTTETGGQANFSIITAGPNIKYQWQSSPNPDGQWTDLTGISESGYNTSSLSIKAPSSTGKIYYRCKITSDCKTSYSDSACLTITLPKVVYIDGTNIPSPDGRELDTNLPVGYTGGAFNADNGAAKYEIPILVPPGTNGMQPSISLSYNSLAGNGLLGNGWNVKGFSSITRINKPYYVDSLITAIDLRGSDSYAIDGNRLVLTSDVPGYEGDKYKTEIETFGELTSRGQSGNGPQWFELKLRNGTVIQFGNEENSVTKSKDGTILNWEITRITDIHGNYCQYVYKSDPLTQNYLERILYTGNDITVLQPYNEIHFYYGKRSDENELYYPGLTVQQKIIITRIECISEGEIIRTYDLNYTANLHSHLVELVEKGKNDSKLNSTIFKWEENREIINRKQGSYLDPENSIFYTGDFNGDGTADILKTPDRTPGHFTASDQWKIYFGSRTGYIAADSGKLGTRFIRFYIADGNNDGSDDIYMQFQEKIKADCPAINTFRVTGNNLVPPDGDKVPGIKCDQDQNRFEFYHWYQNRLVSLPEKQLIFPDEIDNLVMYPADFDGNGLVEYLFTRSDNTLSSFSGIRLRNLPYLGSLSRIFLIDFNGNGKTDIAINRGDNLSVLEYNAGKELFDTLLKDYSLDYIEGIGDFNGDGKTDFLTSNNSPYFRTDIHYSTGNDLVQKLGPVIADLYTGTPPEIVEPFPIKFVVKARVDLIVNDFNGDGKSDILNALFTTTRTYPGEGHFYRDTVSFDEDVYLSTGTEFNSIHVNDGIGRHKFSQIDHNFDGNMDLLITTNNQKNEIVEFFPNDKSQLISSVTDGRNLKTEFSYTSMNDKSVYSHEPEQYKPPVFSATFPIKLLAGVRVYDNNLTSLLGETKYKYYNLKMHRQGRGMLGFSKILARNLTTGHSNISRFEYDTTFYVPYLSQSIDSVNGHVVSKLTSTQSILSLDKNSRYLPYEKSSLTNDILNKTSSETTQELDGSGNIISETMKYFDSAGGIIKQVCSSFSNYNIFGQPGTIMIKNTRGTDSISRTKSFKYYPSTGQVENVTQTFDNSPSLVTSYDYDKFGNNTSVSSSSGGKTYKSSVIYDAGKARFPEIKIGIADDSLKFTYDKTGNILTQKDNSGLITNFDYNNFGRLFQTVLPDKRTITSKLLWSKNIENLGELYYTQSEAPGKPTSREYFDILGRSMRKDIRGFNGIWLRTENKYDKVGRVEKIFGPYYDNETPDQFIQYKYDDYDRVFSEINYPSTNTITYSYDPSIVTIIKAGQKYKKEYDATGKLVTSTDPGGTIKYLYDAEDKINQVDSPSGSTVIKYDDYGFQRTLQDIDAGTIEYRYNAFGELEFQVDANKNEQQLMYDSKGRLYEKKWKGGATIAYKYNSLNGQLRRMISTTGISRRFEYDNLGRLSLKIDSLDKDNRFTASYNYDTETGNQESVLLNNSVAINYNYNDLGYVKQVKVNSQPVWTASSMNKYGVVDDYLLGNQVKTTIKYDANGNIDQLIATRDGKYIQNWNYDFDPVTGNLLSREGLNETGGSIREYFTFDKLNRLLNDSIGQKVYSTKYDKDGLGNIIGKTGIGKYDYNGQVHKVTSISHPSSAMKNLPRQKITYTNFNKVDYLSATYPDETREMNFFYGPDEQRIKTVYKEGGNTILTKYYMTSQYEKEVDASGTTRELYYISGPGGNIAILERKNDVDSMYYIHTDFLGSYDVITRSDGSIKERYSFDPWGRRRNPADWSYDSLSTTQFFDRGFTGHEHLDKFDLINMNGRVYDPLLSMFLSPDNYVQNPEFTINFNRYSYAFGNPLKYTDPSGNYAAPDPSYERGSKYDYSDVPSGNSGLDALPNGLDVWTSYIRATMRGYEGGYGNFSVQFLNNYWDFQFSGEGGGITGGKGPSSMTFTYYTNSTSYGELVAIPGYKPMREAIIIAERHTVTLHFGNSKPGFNIDNAVNALNENGYPSYSAAKAAGDGASCARFIRWSLEAGFGLQKDALKGKAPVPARLYGPFLEGLGFTQVNTTNYLKGDFAVIQGYPGGTADANGVPYGHIQMYNGTDWLSNWKQAAPFWPGKDYAKFQPAFQIYRWGSYP